MGECNCVGTCICPTGVDEINLACETQTCPIVVPVLPPCDIVTPVETYPKAVRYDREAALITAQAFNIPACGNTIVVEFTDLPTVHVGGFIWSSVFGSFQVLAVSGNFLTLSNPCFDSGPIGTFVPVGSTFVLSVSRIIITDPNQSYLAVDFTVPPVGSCSITKLSTITGIANGAQISIGEGIYWLANSYGGGIVQICNTGQGEPPGTILRALNTFGQYQFPVEVVSDSIALESSASSGYAFGETGNVGIQTSMLFINPYFDKPLNIFYNFIGVFNGDFGATVFPKEGILTADISQIIDSILTTDSSSQAFQRRTAVANSEDNSLERKISGAITISPGSFKEVIGSFNILWAGPSGTTLTGSISLRGSAIGSFASGG